MPLEIVSGDATMQHPSPSMDIDSLGYPGNPYPSLSRIAPLSFLFSFTKKDRSRYIKTHCQLTEQLLDIRLTPIEAAGLSYYDSIFYTYRSYGHVLRSITGLCIFFAGRGLKPNPWYTRFARSIGIRDDSHWELLRFLLLTSYSEMQGAYQFKERALRKMRAERMADPRMRRIVVVKFAKAGALKQEEENKFAHVAKPPHKKREESSRKPVEGTPSRMPKGQITAEVGQQLQLNTLRSGDDLLELIFGAESAVSSISSRGSQDRNTQTYESAWERLRRSHMFDFLSDESAVCNNNREEEATFGEDYLVHDWPIRSPKDHSDDKIDDKARPGLFEWNRFDWFKWRLAVYVGGTVYYHS